MSNRKSTVVCLLVAFLACNQQARAESPLLKQGIEEYNAGDYANAVGHFGQALSQEFGNPVMHYYMGNAYVHLKERDSAIREFRIAFALDPKSKVGELAKKALTYMKVDDDTSSKPPEKPKTTPLPKPPTDIVLERTTSSLQDQADRIKNQHTRDSHQRAEDVARTGQNIVQRTRGEIDDNLTYYRRGRAYKLPMPSDASSLLDRLQKMYGSQQATQINEGLKKAEDIQNSAENLNALLRDTRSSHKLVPAGTNLYIRNYQTPTTAPEQKPAAAAPKVDAKIDPRIEQRVEGKIESK